MFIYTSQPIATYEDLIQAVTMIYAKTKQRVILFFDDAQEIFDFDQKEVKDFLLGLVALKEHGIADTLFVFSEGSQVGRVNASKFCARLICSSGGCKKFRNMQH